MKKFSLVLAALILLGNLNSPAYAETGESESPQIPAPIPTAETEAAEASSIFDIIVTAVPTEGPGYTVDLAAYYLEEMCSAAAEGEVDSGREAEQSRNAAIEAVSAEAEEISFDDLYLLARVIYSEAGSDWLSEEFRLCVGEVVLNRVASPEFPDTIYDVVYQKGQYSGVNTLKFSTLKPSRDCVDAALKLLQGERLMVPSVIYQSDYIQGELFSMYSDRRLGNTYFCLSPNQDLYPID